jgi:hypothetical protein
MVAVDYLEAPGFAVILLCAASTLLRTGVTRITTFLRARADYQRLVASGPFYIAKELCEFGPAHSVGIVGVSNEFVQ